MDNRRRVAVVAVGGDIGYGGGPHNSPKCFCAKED